MVFGWRHPSNFFNDSAFPLGYPSFHTMMSEKVAQPCVTTALYWLGSSGLPASHAPYLLVDEEGTEEKINCTEAGKVPFLASFTYRDRSHSPDSPSKAGGKK